MKNVSVFWLYEFALVLLLMNFSKLIVGSPTTFSSIPNSFGMELNKASSPLTLDKILTLANPLSPLNS